MALINKFPIVIGIPQRFIINTKQEYYDYINKHNGIKNLFYLVYNNGDIDKIFFDFDDITTGVSDMLKLHNECLLYDYKHLMLFSGGGFHFYIFTKGNVANPKPTLRSIHQTIIKELNLNIDKHIVGDIQRLARIPNTYNIKRKRFCIPITIEDLSKGYDYIRDKAKHQKFKFVYYNNNLLDITKFKVNTPEITYTPLDTDIEIKIKSDKLLNNIPPCISRLLLKHNINYEERYLVLLYLREFGLPKSTTISIMKKYLTPEKFNHMLLVEHQPDYVYRRGDLMFPKCETLQQRGLCPRKCKYYNKLYKR